MGRRVTLGLMVLCGLGALAEAGTRPRYPYYSGRYRWQKLSGLTVAEQRELGLSDGQIQEIAEKRRGLEREREKMEKALEAARAAARVAQAEPNRIQREINEFATVRIDEVFRSVMTDKQLKEWNRRRLTQLARQWLRSYTYTLKLDEKQVDDVLPMLVPVYEKYEKMQNQLTEAQAELAELRRAEKIDIKAIDAAEKRVAELGKTHPTSLRRNALLDAMKPGLTPEQLGKLNRYYYPRR